MPSPMNGVRPPYTPPSNIVYFHDWRWVDHGYLRWLSDVTNQPVSIMPAPDPLPPMHSSNEWLPRGIRIEVERGVADPEPILTARQMDEILFFGGSILLEDGRYRMWYESVHPDGLGEAMRKHIGHVKYLRYAESDDGITWRRPKLGLVDVKGSKQNNAVFDPGRVGYHGGCVFRDPDGPAGERYKSIFMGMMSQQDLARYRASRPPGDIDPMCIFSAEMAKDRGHAGWAVYGAVSPDGMQWKLIDEPLVVQHSDTANACTYDEFRKKYVAYLRSWVMTRRSVCRAEGDDFRHLGAPEQILWPDASMAPDETWYTPGYVRMPGAPDHHLMFATLWRQTDDTFTPHLHSSMDGMIWSRVPGGAAVPHGPCGSWTQCGMSISSLVPLPGDRFGALAQGWHVPHKYPRTMPGFGQAGWVTWKRGRLTSVRADTEGEFALWPLKFTGRRVVLNYRTRFAGRIQVQAYTTKILRSFDETDPINGDELDRVVTWKGQSDIGHADDESVQLKFRLNGADLFSVRFE